MSLKADFKKSVEFLEKLRPGGSHVITAIRPDMKGISTETCENSDRVLAFLKKHKDDNLYFMVNPPIGKPMKKASKPDVKAMTHLYVDVDPREGEDFASEQERIRALFDEDLPKGIPEPSFVIFSGGGYQGFWALEEPLPIDGSEELWKEAERYNIQLELTFGADPCHNCDRIMRLPGTINRPNERKRKKGQKEARTKVVKWTDKKYPITDFLQAPPLDDGGSEKRGRHKIAVSDNVKRLNSVDDLPPQITDRVRVIIVQGRDPDTPLRGEDQSRSAWLFHVCCELVRADMTDDEIYAIITDPGFGISASVLDKGSRAKKYAVKQIESARDQAVSPELREFNEKYAVILDLNGKCRILVEGWDAVRDRPRVSFMSFQDFNNAHNNRSVIVGSDQNGKPLSMPAGKWWVGNPLRRQYEDVVFAPGKDLTKVYNLWRGFAFDPKPGDCSLFLEHLRQNLCGGCREYYDYLLGWMAMAVQRPARQGHVAVVLRGGRGTGKSFFANHFGKLFGNHYLRVSNAKHVTGAFNAHLQDTLVLFSDEAFAANDKRAEGVLKTLITEEELTIEPKGVDARMSPNFLHLILASNEEWVVPAGFDERRFFVLDVSTNRQQDVAYFRAVRKQLENGGYEALLHTLLAHNLKDFEVRTVPHTMALDEQKVLSLKGPERWLYEKLQSGELIVGKGWSTRPIVSELVYDFALHQRIWENSSERSTSTKLGMCLKRFFGTMKREAQPKQEVRAWDGSIVLRDKPMAYIFPTLDEARRAWDEVMKSRTDWPEVVDFDEVTGTDEPF